MATWLADIVSAFQELGGIATLNQIYEEVGKTRRVDHTQTIRRIVYDHSSDSDGYKGGDDLFYSVEGTGKGLWGLRGFRMVAPVARDIEPPERVKTETYRILRDTALARTLKKLHKDRCQICGTVINFPNGGSYSEAHHIRPLGPPHSGPDSASNILVLCPNHHVLCDYAAVQLNLKEIEHHPNHRVSTENLAYHNSNIHPWCVKLCQGES